MSAKILKFTPRADNKLYAQGQVIPVASVISIKKAEVVKIAPAPQPPLVTYAEYMKMVNTTFTARETKALNDFGFFWDEKYQAMYPTEENYDGELVEKRGKFFFYLYVLPFNMYPSEYKVFKSLKDLKAFLSERYSGPDNAG